MLQISAKIHRLYELSIPHVQIYPVVTAGGALTCQPDVEKENTPSLRDAAHKNSITLFL